MTDLHLVSPTCKQIDLEQAETELRSICARFRARGFPEWLRAVLESELKSTPKRVPPINVNVWGVE